MSQELWKLSAMELISLYKKGKSNPLEVCKDIIQTINKKNSQVNAYVAYDEDRIIEQAKASSNRWANKSLKGMLDGVPVSIKDLIITKDYHTKRGSYVESIPVNSNKDAPVVSKIKDHGGIILGKTTTPEFGHKGTTQSNRFGDTLNPWNLELNAGGSSGGSSAAVAAGFGPLSIGTDGGGSIRIPCSFCGLFGHKPTFGKIPAYPISPFGTLANLGPISRKVLDSALLMNVIATPHKDDWNSLPSNNIKYDEYNYNRLRSLKVGVLKFWGMDKYINNLKIDEEVNNKIDEAINLIKKDKLNIIEIEEIKWPNDPVDIFKTLWYAGAANLAKKIRREEFEKIDKNFLSFISRGEKYSAFDLMGAEANRAENSSFLNYLFEDFDLIVGPTLPVTSFNTKLNVPEGWDQGDLFSWTPFTYPFNLTKHPASTINCNFTKNNLPVGIQLVAPLHEDKRCFLFANYLEKLFDLSSRWPNL